MNLPDILQQSNGIVEIAHENQSDKEHLLTLEDAHESLIETYLEPLIGIKKVENVKIAVLDPVKGMTTKRNVPIKGTKKVPVDSELVRIFQAPTEEEKMIVQIILNGTEVVNVRRKGFSGFCPKSIQEQFAEQDEEDD